MQSRASKAAQAHSQKREGTGGKFGKLNPCHGCTKSAGEHYFSHPLTDSLSPKGVSWGDLALVLCPRCMKATHAMVEPIEFAEYAAARGGLSPKGLAYQREQAAKGEAR